MLGIPGDYTSISRFVRIAFMNQFIEKAQSTEESINVISRMLSAVYIPKGVKFKSNGLTDYTQFTSFMDLSNGTYYINFYENNRYLKLNIKEISETISTPKEFKVETTMILKHQKYKKNCDFCHSSFSKFNGMTEVASYFLKLTTYVTTFF